MIVLLGRPCQIDPGRRIDHFDPQGKGIDARRGSVNRKIGHITDAVCGRKNAGQHSHQEFCLIQPAVISPKVAAVGI